MNPLLQITDTTGIDPSLMGNAVAGFMAMFAILMFINIIVGIIVYLYFSLTLMIVANKTKTQPSWLAWIPIANFYLKSKIAKEKWWPILMIIPAVIGYSIAIFGVLSQNRSVSFIALPLVIISALILAVYMVIWEWKICVARGRPGWWALLSLGGILLFPVSFIPLIGPILWFIGNVAAGIWGFVMWGILAWGK